MSILNSTTIQYRKDPSESETEHCLTVKKISSHEIEVSLKDFNNIINDGHHIDYIALYCSKQMVDIVYLDPEKDKPIVIFDLDKINKKRIEELENSDLEHEWIPIHWDINQEYHAIAQCNIHGIWSDVNEEYL